MLHYLQWSQSHFHLGSNSNSIFIGCDVPGGSSDGLSPIFIWALIPTSIFNPWDVLLSGGLSPIFIWALIPTVLCAYRILMEHSI